MTRDPQILDTKAHKHKNEVKCQIRNSNLKISTLRPDTIGAAEDGRNKLEWAKQRFIEISERLKYQLEVAKVGCRISYRLCKRV